jgi:hypothetical protein
MWIQYGKADNLPLIVQAVTGSARRRPRYSISEHALAEDSFEHRDPVSDRQLFHDALHRLGRAELRYGSLQGRLPSSAN